jgi:hypothetical protein
MFVLNINTDLTDESILHPIDIDTAIKQRRAVDHIR